MPTSRDLFVRVSIARRPQVMRIGALTLTLAWLLAPGPVAADDYDEFRSAQEAFRSQDYQAAATILENLVLGPAPRVDGPLRLEARKYLAASYVFLGRAGEAEPQFEALLNEDPQHELNPVAFSSEVVELFRAVRTRVRAARERAAREEAARQARQREQEQARIRRLEALALASREAEESAPSRFIAAIPFGPGQFQNDNPTLGWFFAIAGAVTGLTSIVAAVFYQSLTNQLSDAISQGEDDQAMDIRSARDAAALTNRLSFAAFGALGIASIVDAQVRFRATPESEAASPSADVRLFPGGLSLVGTF